MLPEDGHSTPPLTEDVVVCSEVHNINNFEYFAACRPVRCGTGPLRRRLFARRRGWM
jgi:hypothetical protein